MAWCLMAMRRSPSRSLAVLEGTADRTPQIADRQASADDARNLTADEMVWQIQVPTHVIPWGGDDGF